MLDTLHYYENCTCLLFSEFPPSALGISMFYFLFWFLFYLAYSAIRSKITMHLLYMFVFLRCCFHCLSEIMNQQTLPDKLVEANAALESELKVNIPIVPHLLSNQKKKSSIQKAMIYTILNYTPLLCLKTL